MRPRKVIEQLQKVIHSVERLADSQADQIQAVSDVVIAALARGQKLLLFGNGGSAATAQHMATEFVGRFQSERRPWPALALTSDTSVVTAIANDYGFETIFARQIRAVGCPGDVAIAISTSGRSPNVLQGIEAATEMGLTTVALAGADGGPLAESADLAVIVPSADTPRIQECHLVIGHVICDAVDVALSADSLQTDYVALTGRSANAARPHKLKEWSELFKLRERWRRERKRVVWTNGCFDVLHAGHLRSLFAAREMGDVLVVGINSDESVRRLKGPGRPIVTAYERAELVAAFECVDSVVIFDAPTPELAIRQLRPDVHCKGAEYSPAGARPAPEAPFVTANGGSVEFLPMLPNHSTTELIARIQQLLPRT